MGRRTLAVAISLALLSPIAASASDRFGRPVQDVADKKTYQFFRLDETSFPYLQRDSTVVSCITYKGSQYYYVEVSITNNSCRVFDLDANAITFSKPGYTIFRTSTLDAANDAAQTAGIAFEPTPAPQVGSTTAVNATATHYGGMVVMSGTSTTGPSAQQGAANLGNAIGNMIASSQFAANQSEEARFARFLRTFALEQQSGPVKPGETKVVVATFEQIKPALRPYSVTVRAGSEEFVFNFREP